MKKRLVATSFFFLTVLFGAFGYSLQSSNEPSGPEANSNPKSVVVGQQSNYFPDDEASTVSSTNEWSQMQRTLMPDACIVIARDFEGIFLDCGCQSSQSGGMARAAGVASMLCADNFSVLAIGNHYDASASVDRHALSKDVFDALEAIPFLFFSTPSNSEFKLIEGVRLHVDSRDSVRLLAANSEYTFRLPKLNSRGRELFVIALWHENRSEDGFVYDAEIGRSMKFLRFNNSPSAEEEIRRKLVEIQPSILTTFTVSVGIRTPEETRTALAVDGVLQRRLHGSGFELSPSVARLDDHSFYASTCSSCHAEQVSRWKSTRHSKALSSLIPLMRTLDPRCTVCHASSLELPIPVPHRGVTCYSCHNKTNSPANGCVACHTDTTDPEEIFLEHFNEVCSSGLPRKGGPCVR